MSNRKGKAPAGAGTPTRARGNGLATTFPNRNNSTEAQKTPPISELLHKGSGNGITLSELVALTGEDERSIRRRIQMERKDGKLILSDNQSGYFLPASEHEVRRFIRSMSRRSREIAAISRIAEDVLLKLAGQETMEGLGNG